MILGYAELLGQAKLTGDKKEYVSAIEKYSRGFADILHVMIDVSLFDPEQEHAFPQDFNLLSLVKNAIRIARIAEKARKAVIRLDYDVPRRLFKGYPARIRQALITMLHQTMSETPKGNVIVSLKEMQGINTGSDYRIMVEIKNTSGNNGETRRSGRGNTISEEIDFLREMLAIIGGRVIFSGNIAGEKRVLSLTLEEASCTGEEYVRATPPATLCNLPVWIIESMDELSVVLSRQCEQCGLRVTRRFNTTEKAIAAIEDMRAEDAPKFIIARFDMRNRRDTGLGAISNANTVLKNTRLIGISAHAFPGVVQKLEAAGFHAYLSMPFTCSELQGIFGILAEDKLHRKGILTRYSIEDRKNEDALS
jgi:CheY-like chemotaxis protein